MSYQYRIALSVVVLGVALGVVFLAAGCGSSPVSPEGSGGGIPPSPAGTAESGPAPLNDGALPAAPTLIPITPAPGRRERVAEWRVAGRSEDGRRLLLDVTIGGPPCDAVTGIDVVEAAQAVTVTIQAGRLASADCPAGVTGALATVRVEVELSQPLGDRQLLGGS